MKPGIKELQATIANQRKHITRGEQAEKLLKTHAWKVVIEEGFFENHLNSMVANLPALAGDEKEKAVAAITAVGVLKSYLKELPILQQQGENAVSASTYEMDRMRGKS